MSLNLESIKGRYLSDLLSQPQALRATWTSLGETPVLQKIAGACNKDRFQRIVLTGMGSSYFGLHPLCIELAEHGWTPLMVETSELIHYYAHLLSPSTLVVAVSQSGASVEMARMLDLNARRSTIIGLTNQPDSPLARLADHALLTLAGEEFSVSCKTYVSAQMAMGMLGAALCGRDRPERTRDMESASEAVGLYLQDWITNVEALAELLHDIRQLFLVGRGPSLAAVRTGALIIKESDHFHAEGMSSAAFRHGPFEMLQPGLFVGVFMGDEKTKALNEGLLQDIQRTRAQAVSFSADADLPACKLPDVPEAARPIVEILPVQMMTLALAALGNREPGRFDRATKITVIE